MRNLTKAASLAAAMFVTTTAAHAQTMVAGSTTGCFGLNCTNYSSTATYAIGASGESINFAGTSFSGMTNVLTNAFTVGSFGSFQLVPAPSASTPSTLFSTPFTLLFTLTSPAGANSPSTTFTLSGVVGPNSRDISYTGGVTPFTFTGGAGTITTDGGQIGTTATTISGRVTATAVAAVPESATWAMMIGGFGLVGGAARYRRRKTLATFA